MAKYTVRNSIVDAGGRLDEAEAATASEIRQVEDDQGCPLPASYREFLSLCGRGFKGHSVLASEDIFYPDMLGLKEELQRELSSGDINDPVRTGEYVVFMAHQGYIFYMLRSDEIDCSVFGYSIEEPERGMVKCAASLADFMLEQFRDDRSFSN
ncbi:SMI1/KNR4 family protein [Streptomyces aculeolatus]|uniref:SMI1/KNR4 family protein n=1 Tax=Streptomyces aculeolatus TaxID=270689 RepID=UPI001CED93CF|nr:SMI1/KNR4 family protein [Streptomyces aculeolatus]